VGISADFVIMAVTYAAVASVFVYLAVKYVEAEAFHFPEKETGKKSSSISRLTFLGKVTWVVIKNPLTLIIITTVILTSLVSGYAATSCAGYAVFNLRKGYGSGQAVLLEFSHVVSKVAAEKSLNIIAKRLNEPGARLTWYARHVLSRPIKLKCGGRVHTIYVLLGVSADEIKKLFNTSAREITGELFYAGISPKAKVNATLIMGNGKTIAMIIKGIPSSVIAGAEIMPGVPLLPIQSYIGTKPVTPPPKYVLIGEISVVNSVIDMPRNAVTDVLITGGTEPYSLHTLTQLVAREASISRIWFLNGSKLYVISTVQVPTTESMLVALLSSATATVLCLAVASALLPSLKNLYLRLSIQGMPPWSASIINTAYTMLVALIPGIIVVIYTYRYLGGVSAFNSLVSVAITWVLMLTYVSLKSKPPKLRTDVYSPPSQRYTIFLKRRRITEVVEEILASLKGNEFFELLEFESQVRGGEAVIHARLAYVESWGIGADMNVLISSTEEGIYVNISSVIWGIEEVSEVIMNNVLALLLSRIVGRLRSWELSRY